MCKSQGNKNLFVDDSEIYMYQSQLGNGFQHILSNDDKYKTFEFQLDFSNSTGIEIFDINDKKFDSYIIERVLRPNEELFLNHKVKEGATSISVGYSANLRQC